MSFAKKIPILRGFAYQSTPYQVGSVIENRLGLQVFRVLGKHFVHQFRSGISHPEFRQTIETVERDGVAMLSGFLGESEYAAVLEDLDKSRAAMVEQSFRRDGRLSVAKCDVAVPGYDAIDRFLRKSPLIRSVVESIMRIRVTRDPNAEYAIFRCTSPEAPDNDDENILHADLHCVTVKAFYYPQPVTRSNGAYIYVKGSNRVNLTRLHHEYELSIRVAKLRAGRSIPVEYTEQRAGAQRNIIRHDLLARMGAAETQFECPGNTLILTNNIGFHRRGNFDPGAVREHVLINFRGLNRPFI